MMQTNTKRDFGQSQMEDSCDSSRQLTYILNHLFFTFFFKNSKDSRTETI